MLSTAQFLLDALHGSLAAASVSACDYRDGDDQFVQTVNEVDENTSPSRWQALSERLPSSVSLAAPKLTSSPSVKKGGGLPPKRRLFRGSHASLHRNSNLMLYSQELEAVEQQLQSAAQHASHTRIGASTSQSKQPGPLSATSRQLTTRGPMTTTSSALEQEAKRLMDRVKALSSQPAAPVLPRPSSASSLVYPAAAVVGAGPYGGSSSSVPSSSRSVTAGSSWGALPASSSGIQAVAAACASATAAVRSQQTPMEGLLGQMELQSIMQQLLKGSEEAEEDRGDVGEGVSESMPCIPEDPTAAAAAALHEAASCAEEKEQQRAEERGRACRMLLLMRRWRLGGKMQKMQRLYAMQSIRRSRWDGLGGLLLE